MKRVIPFLAALSILAACTPAQIAAVRAQDPTQNLPTISTVDLTFTYQCTTLEGAVFHVNNKAYADMSPKDQRRCTKIRPVKG